MTGTEMLSKHRLGIEWNAGAAIQEQPKCSTNRCYLGFMKKCQEALIVNMARNACRMYVQIPAGLLQGCVVNQISCFNASMKVSACVTERVWDGRHC